MKGHYKGEFNMASLLKQKPVDDDEDEDDWSKSSASDANYSHAD